jgi:hypothetical protein
MCIAAHNTGAHSHCKNWERNSEPQQHIRRSNVNVQFTRQVEDFFAAAANAVVPDNIQSIAEDGVAKTREVYLKISSVTKDGVKAFEDAITPAYAGAKTIGEKVVLNIEANTRAAFDSAQSISRARTVPEVVRLQSSYLQKQVVATSVQTKELCELWAKVVLQTYEAMNSAASKTFEQLQKAA